MASRENDCLLRQRHHTLDLFVPSIPLESQADPLALVQWYSTMAGALSAQQRSVGAGQSLFSSLDAATPVDCRARGDFFSEHPPDARRKREQLWLEAVEDEKRRGGVAREHWSLLLMQAEHSPSSFDIREKNEGCPRAMRSAAHADTPITRSRAVSGLEHWLPVSIEVCGSCRHISDQRARLELCQRALRSAAHAGRIFTLHSLE